MKDGHHHSRSHMKWMKRNLFFPQLPSADFSSRVIYQHHVNLWACKLNQTQANWKVLLTGSDQHSANFFCRGSSGKYDSSAGHMQFCYCSMKAFMDINDDMLCYLFTYRNSQWAGFDSQKPLFADPWPPLHQEWRQDYHCQELGAKTKWVFS